MQVVVLTLGVVIGPLQGVVRPLFRSRAGPLSLWAPEVRPGMTRWASCLGLHLQELRAACGVLTVSES